MERARGKEFKLRRGPDSMIWPVVKYRLYFAQPGKGGKFSHRGCLPAARPTQDASSILFLGLIAVAADPGLGPARQSASAADVSWAASLALFPTRGSGFMKFQNRSKIIRNAFFPCVRHFEHASFCMQPVL